MATEQDWEKQLAASLPKLELHLHLDGSLSTGKLFKLRDTDSIPFSDC
jgi:adenosine deaminase